ncbi:response regulator [Microbacterium sp. 179-I 3D3 NHS]|uniref:response regulator n=1 Tax=Microbacterium sp. 179-I 3D3 NHS TaxID=3142382 RepID=UPI0039A02C17
MFVSVEVITTIAAAVSIVVAFAGLLGWFIRRLDARFDRVDARFDRVELRIDRVELRIDRVEDQLSGFRHELTEVKIAVARLEGPHPRLITAR